MAPDDKNSAASNQPLSGDNVNENQNAASTDAQDQTLVKALQDLVVRVMNPKEKNEMNQIHLGSEAGKFITALQEFISSIVVRSQPKAQNTIEVGLEDEDEPQEGNPDDNRRDDESSSKVRSLPKSPSVEAHRGDEIKNNNSTGLVTLQQSQPPIMNKFLRELKEHIFNTMPIRLLCFEVYGSKFRIELLERGAIYARLASTLPGKIREEEFHPQRVKWRGVEEENEVIKRLISKYLGYAILSHTWLRTTSGEVTYGDWNKGQLDPKDPGYRKLVAFCKAAWNDYRITFGWMDTVCINKDSSSELDESIRSMYSWYSRATVCITYLAETETLSNMHLDPWFTRGWTLQELLAPHVITFYNGRWRRLVGDSRNDKENRKITQQIERATTLRGNELTYIHHTPISRRMQLAATREVTREEDTAYSLMGIFGISISIAYGEGASRAFYRLLQEILNTSKDALDILNWAGELPSSRPYTSRILPTSPKHYIARSSRHLEIRQPTEPLTLTHLGLRIPVILMRGSSAEVSQPRAIGTFSAIVSSNSAPQLLQHPQKL